MCVFIWQATVVRVRGGAALHCVGSFSLAASYSLSLLSLPVTLTHLKDVRNASHLYEEALKQNKLVSMCACMHVYMHECVCVCVCDLDGRIQGSRCICVCACKRTCNIFLISAVIIFVSCVSWIDIIYSTGRTLSSTSTIACCYSAVVTGLEQPGSSLYTNPSWGSCMENCQILTLRWI